MNLIFELETWPEAKPNGAKLNLTRGEAERSEAKLETWNKNFMEEQKHKWKKSYSIVLILNALYILIFYLLMEIYN